MVPTQASRTRMDRGRVTRRGSGLRNFMRSSVHSRSLRASEEGPGWDYRLPGSAQSSTGPSLAPGLYPAIGLTTRDWGLTPVGHPEGRIGV